MDTHPYAMVGEALKKNMVSERLQSFFEQKVKQRTEIETKYAEMLTDWVGDIIMPRQHLEGAYLDTDLIRRVLSSLREEGKQHLNQRHQLITNLQELLADIQNASEEGSKKLYDIKGEFENMTEKRSEVKNALLRQRNIKGSLQQDNLLTMRMSPDGRGPEWAGTREGLHMDSLNQRRNVCEKTVQNLENKLSELDINNAKDLHYMYTQLEMKEDERMGSILLQTKMFLGNLQSCWTPQRSPRPPPASAHHAGRELRQNLQGLSDTRELLEKNWADVAKNAELQAKYNAHVRSVGTAEIQQATKTAELEAQNAAELQTALNVDIQTPRPTELQRTWTAEMYALEAEELTGLMDSDCLQSTNTASDNKLTMCLSPEPKETPGCLIDSEYCTDTATKPRLIRCKSAIAPPSAIREDIRATFSPLRPTYIAIPSCTEHNTSSSRNDNKSASNVFGGDVEEIVCPRKVATVRAIPRQDKEDQHAQDCTLEEVEGSLSVETLQLPAEVVCERSVRTKRDNQWFDDKTRREQRSSTADKNVPADNRQVSGYTTTSVLPLKSSLSIISSGPTVSYSTAASVLPLTSSSSSGPNVPCSTATNGLSLTSSSSSSSESKLSRKSSTRSINPLASASSSNSNPHANRSASDPDVLQYGGGGGVDSSTELVDVSMLADATVIAVKNNMRPINAAELEFKVGQVIHQTAALDENGYCYGYMDSNKLLGRRRLGFYTPDKVTLKPVKGRKQKRGLNNIFAALQGKYI